MNSRQKYIVIKDFTDNLPMGNSIFKCSYKKGETMNLKTGGKTWEKWISKGYIKPLN